MANEHRRIYFTNMISNCNVAYVNELYLKNDLNQIVRQEIQKRLDNCGVKRLRLRDYLQNSVLATRKNIQSIDRSKSRATDHVYSDETIFSLSHSSRSSICCLASLQCINLLVTTSLQIHKFLGYNSLLRKRSYGFVTQSFLPHERSFPKHSSPTFVGEE